MKKKVALLEQSPDPVQVVFIVTFLCLFIGIFVFSDSAPYFTKINFLLSNRALLVISLAVCIVLSILMRKKRNRVYSYRQVILIFGLVSLLLFIFQLFLISNMYFLTGWDAGGVRDAVFEIVNKTYNIQYPYSTYPSQINITALMVGIVKLARLINLDGYFGILLVNALFVNLSGVFTSLSAYQITKNIKISIFSFGIFTLWVGLSPWILIPYRDTFSILYPIMAFYLYTSRKPDGDEKVRWFFIGLLCLYGATIKQTILIVLIAIMIVELRTALTKKDRKTWEKLFLSVTMIILAILPVFMVNMVSTKVVGVELDPQADFSIYHLIMMGLNEDTTGVFSMADAQYSYSFSNAKERNQGNLEVIKQRLNNFGVFGYLDFLTKKSFVNFADGTFAWGVEGNFYQEIPKRTNSFALTLKDIFYNNGNLYPQTKTIQQVLWFVILLLALFMGVITKKPDNNQTILLLSILGLIIALLLFEARARYIYNFSPLFVLAASIGLDEITKNLNDIRKEPGKGKLDQP